MLLGGALEKGRGKSKCFDYLEFGLWKLHAGAAGRSGRVLQSGSGTSENSHWRSGSQGMSPPLRHTPRRVAVRVLAQEPEPSAMVGTGQGSVLWIIMVKMHNKVFNNVNLSALI